VAVALALQSELFQKKWVFGEYKTYLEVSQGWVQLNVSADVGSLPTRQVSAVFLISISTPGATVCVDNAALTEVDGKPQQVSKHSICVLQTHRQGLFQTNA
jgi:hypothetical protein